MTYCKCGKRVAMLFGDGTGPCCYDPNANPEVDKKVVSEKPVAPKKPKKPRMTMEQKKAREKAYQREYRKKNPRTAYYREYARKKYNCIRGKFVIYHDGKFKVRYSHGKSAWLQFSMAHIYTTRAYAEGAVRQIGYGHVLEWKETEKETLEGLK